MSGNADATAAFKLPSGPNTFAATGDYNTGMGSATYSTPRYDVPAVSYSQGAGGNGWVTGLTATTGQVYLLYVSNYSQSGLSFTLSWQLSGGSSLDCTVLPVELLSLTADVEGPDIAVRWSTATEHNSDYFSVERSSDGTDFKPLAAMDAAGVSQQRIDYLYMDTDPPKGANYYRLKQVDIDGQFVYTYTVVALMGHTDDAPLLFPNPVKASLHIAFNMPINGPAIADVLDASGRSVKQVSFTLERGQRTVDVDVAELGAGAYQLRLTTAPDAPSTVSHFIKE